MERSLIFLILGLGLIWVLMDEFTGDHKIITRIVNGIFNKSDDPSLFKWF